MTENRASRRRRVRQLKAELVAAYLPATVDDGPRASELVPTAVVQNSNSNCPETTACTTTIPEEGAQSHFVDWIQQDPSLLWEPFGSGSTLMHWASQRLRYEQINHCANNNTSNGIWKSITDPWEWLLQQATTTTTTTDKNQALFTTLQDGSGETCLDCFMLAWHHKGSSTLLPSMRSRSRQRRQDDDPYRFSAALEAIRQQPTLLYHLETLVQRDELMMKIMCQQQQSSKPPVGRTFDRRVTIVHKVYKALVRIYMATRINDDDTLVAYLARTGRSLEPFAWLAITLDDSNRNKNASCAQPNAKLELPLHLWASSPPATTDELDGLWEHLLEAYPAAVTHADVDGNLPIHRALQCQRKGGSNNNNNKPIRQAQTLAMACPATLGCPDPQTGFYPFGMAAIAARHERRALLRATERRHPSQPLYDWLDTVRRSRDASHLFAGGCDDANNNSSYEQEVSAALLGHVYSMLRTLPQALEYTRARPKTQSITKLSHYSAHQRKDTNLTVELIV